MVQSDLSSFYGAYSLAYLYTEIAVLFYIFSVKNNNNIPITRNA